MLVKASRITTLTDARYFASKSVDFLGFNLEEGSEGYLDPIYMKAIREWVEGPLIVGEFSSAPAPVIQEAATFYGLDAVQVSNLHTARQLEQLTVLLEIVVRPDWTEASILALLAQPIPSVTYYVLNFVEYQPDWAANRDFWRQVCADHPVLLHLDGPANAILATQQALQPAGLSFTGGEEEQTGVKSFDDLEDLFDLLHEQNLHDE
jgi:phosphoribosylanthranilate isomerase